MPPTAMTEGFEEYLRERRERAERTQRLLIGVLAVTCIALAVSNVVLALWITSGRARPPAESATRSGKETPPRSAQSAEAPPSASVPSRSAAPARREAPAQPDVAPPRPEGALPSVTLPKTTESAPADSRSASAPAESPSSTPTEPSARAEVPPAEQLPPRSGITSSPERRESAARTPTASAPARAGSATRPGPGPAATEEATATWMLSTYGRDAAESRARAALQFYNAQSAEGRYWRRVLALIVAAR